MGTLASELLARALTTEGERQIAPAPVRWTSRDLGVPTVDLDDKEALRDALDRRL